MGDDGQGAVISPSRFLGSPCAGVGRDLIWQVRGYRELITTHVDVILLDFSNGDSRRAIDYASREQFNLFLIQQPGPFDDLLSINTYRLHTFTLPDLANSSPHQGPVRPEDTHLPVPSVASPCATDGQALAHGLEILTVPASSPQRADRQLSPLKGANCGTRSGHAIRISTGPAVENPIASTESQRQPVHPLRIFGTISALQATLLTPRGLQACRSCSEFASGTVEGGKGSKL